jgi:hypothetical protein
MKGLLNLLLLALIVTLVINLVCKIVRKCLQFEGFDNIGGGSAKSVDSEPALTNDDPIVSYNNTDIPRMLHDPSQGCTVCENDLAVDDYIRRNLISTECKETADVKGPVEQFNGDAVEKYRSDHFNFRNFTNQMANGGNDAVDRVNELYLQENTDNANVHKGTTIKDLYHSLTKSDNLHGQPCSKFQGPTMSDNLVEGTAHISNENVDNGGVFFGSVVANDLFEAKQRSL